MSKGLIPLKLVFYAIVLLIVLAIAFVILGTIYTSVNNYTLGLPENVKPVTPSERSIISIDNVKVSYMSGFVTKDITNSAMIKNAHDNTVLYVTFDITVPSSSEFRTGLDVKFNFKGYGNGEDFDECDIVVEDLMPGETRSVKSDECASTGKLVLKPLWSGPTTVKITAKRISEDAILSAYAPFKVYLARSTLEGGDLCTIINNAIFYPRKGAYVFNDMADIELGNYKIESMGTQMNFLTIGTSTESCGGRVLHFMGVDGSSWRNTVTSPEIPEEDSIIFKSLGRIAIFENGDSMDCSSILPTNCILLNAITGGKSVYIELQQ